MRLMRIKNHDTSCLVAETQDPIKAPRVNLWILYKDTSANVVYIQNRLLFGSIYQKVINGAVFTIENCYDFIQERRIVSAD